MNALAQDNVAQVNWNEVKVGDKLPSLTKPPITRATLALFAGASNDHNPIHIDSDFAKAAGMDDVFAHGALSMAWLAQALTHWVPQSALRSFKTKFSAITPIGAEITCSGKVMELIEGDERLARIHMTATDQHGEVKLSSEALVAVPTA